MLSFLIGKKVESTDLGIGIITNEKQGKVDMDFPMRPFKDVLVDEQFLTKYKFNPGDISKDEYELIVKSISQRKKEEKRKAQVRKKASSKNIVITEDCAIPWHIPKPSNREYTWENFILESKGALEEEIESSNKKPETNGVVTNGTLLYKDDKQVYQFLVETKEKLIVGSSIILISFDKMERVYGGIVKSVDQIDWDTRIVVEFGLDKEITKNIYEFSINHSYLLENLQYRLDEINPEKSVIAKYLVTCDKAHLSTRYRSKSYLDQCIQFIWGPPGTGKTTRLSQQALEHLNKGERVLILSHTNIAVDEAILRIKQKSFGKYNFSMGRYGYTNNKEIAEDTDLYTYAHLQNIFKELKQEQKQLEKEKKILARKLKSITDNPNNKELNSLVEKLTKDIIEKAKAIESIDKQIRQEEKAYLSKLQLIATTITQTILKSVLYEGYYDVVIVDEASMVYIPYLIFCASLARSKFYCIGDFLQLPPITKSRNKLLSKDIFAFCSIPQFIDTREFDQGYEHLWVDILRNQYRLPKTIHDFINVSFYRQIMKSNDKNAGKSIFYDTGNPLSLVVSDSNGSKINIWNAFSSVMKILHESQNYESFGYVSPFKKQAALVEAILDDLGFGQEENNNNNIDIKVSTVHKFQGSERDLIIYDSVAKHEKDFRNPMLSSKNNDYANRLFNVALTRTKEKFILIGDRPAILSNLDPKDFLLSKFAYFSSKEKIAAKFRRINDNFNRIVDPDDAINNFFNDLAKAREQVTLYFDRPVNSENQFLPHTEKTLRKLNSIGVEIKLVGSNPGQIPNSLAKYIVNKKEIRLPLAIIDDIVWYGHPLAFYQSRSFKYEFTRFKGYRTSRLLSSLN